MDTFSHGLWSYVLFITSGHPVLAVLAGMLPDMIAFVPAIVYNFFHDKLPRGPDSWKKAPSWVRNWAEQSYNVTHSLVISSIVIAIVWVFFGIQWWLLAWTLHILIDIPTHSKKFFGTPFLWPISNFKIDGIPWSNWKFMTGDVILLFIVYVWVFAF